MKETGLGCVMATILVLSFDYIYVLMLLILQIYNSPVVLLVINVCKCVWVWDSEILQNGIHYSYSYSLTAILF